MRPLDGPTCSLAQNWSDIIAPYDATDVMYDVDGPGKLSLKGIDDACTKNGFASSDSGNARPPFMESKPGPPALDRAFSNSTKPRSPRTITLGVEVETVIGNHDDCDNILPKVLSSMRKLQAQGTWDIGADVYLRHKEPVPDRRKFLVMEDNSIDERIPLTLHAAKELETDVYVRSSCAYTADHETLYGSISSDGAGLSNYDADFYYGTMDDDSASASSCSNTYEWEDDYDQNDDYYQYDDWDPEFSPISSAPGSPLIDELASFLGGETPRFSLPIEAFPPRNQPAIIPRDNQVSDSGSFIRGKGVEVCTPIMTEKNYSRIMTTFMGHFHQEFELHFNRSTGLHVHVGCGEGNAWELEQLHSLAKAVVIFEGLIDRFHPVYRCNHISWTIDSNRNYGDIKNCLISKVFSLIDTTASFHHLIQLIGPQKFYKYNFSCNETYGTIEFRQAAGTGDVNKICDWIKFIVQFVRASLETEDHKWKIWSYMVGMGTANEVIAGLEPAILDRFGFPASLCFLSSDYTTTATSAPAAAAPTTTTAFTATAVTATSTAAVAAATATTTMLSNDSSTLSDSSTDADAGVVEASSFCNEIGLGWGMEFGQRRTNPLVSCEHSNLSVAA